MADLKMFAAGVTNGSHFVMNTRAINFGWKNSIQVENEPGKSIGSPWNDRSPSFRYGGYESPSLNIEGIIDTSLTALGSYPGGSLLITVQRLGSMSLAGSAYVLYPLLGNFLGSPFSNTFTGSVPCVISAVSLLPTLEYQLGSEYIVNYSMNLRIVSGPV